MTPPGSGGCSTEGRRHQHDSSPAAWPGPPHPSSPNRSRCALNPKIRSTAYTVAGFRVGIYQRRVAKTPSATERRITLSWTTGTDSTDTTSRSRFRTVGIGLAALMMLFASIGVAIASFAVGTAVAVTATGSSNSKAATDYDSVPWNALPVWLTDSKGQVQASTGPDNAAVYTATVTGRSITSGKEAQISLSYTVEGNIEPQSTSETLAMIEALEEKICGELVGQSPQDTLDRLLPDGTRVSVVDDREGTGSAAFMHVIPQGDRGPSEEPPNGSVNEGLVATATWTPKNTSGSTWFQDPWTNSSLEWTEQASTSLSPTQALYAPLIVAAANESWQLTEQGQVCEAYRAEEDRREQAERLRKEIEDRLKAQQAEQHRLAAEQEAQRLEAERQAAEAQRLEAERRAALAQQWQAPAAPAPAPPTQGGSGNSAYSYQLDTTPYGTPCGPGDRDGDGDGVCNESR